MLLVCTFSVVEPGKPAWKKIVQHFGSDILHDDGTLNREKMAKIIFSDTDKRRLLNSITHPQIYKSMLRSLFKYLITGKYKALFVMKFVS